MKFSVVTLVGPGEAELERLDRLLRSVLRFSSRIGKIVLVDDSVTSRGLNKRFAVPPHVQVISLVHERRGDGPGNLGGMCMGMLQALRYLSSQSDCDAVLKLDTDALVIGPFEDKLEQLLQREPNLGTAGVVRLDCNGAARDWEPYGSITRRLAEVFRLRRHPLLRRGISLFGEEATRRRLVRRARRHGYEWGEHSQGGSYLISRLLIDRMQMLGFLDHGGLWLKVFMSEDAMMGLYCRACGLQNVPFGGTGEVFGVSHIGLPCRPPEILGRQYAVVHSTKNNPETEEEIFEFFHGNAREKQPANPQFLQP